MVCASPSSRRIGRGRFGVVEGVLPPRGRAVGEVVGGRRVRLRRDDDGPGGVNTWFQITAGRSAALFAVLAGVSIALTTRSRPDRTTAGNRLALAARALTIALIGLFLGVPDSGLAVILTFYGVLFLVALPVLTWSARSLGLLALCWGLLSPVVSIAVRRHLPPP